MTMFGNLVINKIIVQTALKSKVCLGKAACSVSVSTLVWPQLEPDTLVMQMMLAIRKEVDNEIT